MDMNLLLVYYFGTEQEYRNKFSVAIRVNHMRKRYKNSKTIILMKFLEFLYHVISLESIIPSAFFLALVSFTSHSFPPTRIVPWAYVSFKFGLFPGMKSYRGIEVRVKRTNGKYMDMAIVERTQWNQWNQWIR